MSKLNSKRIAILATDGFEQSELMKPLEAFKKDGAEVKVIAPMSGKIKGWSGQDWGDEVPVDMTLDKARVEDFDALVLPGGVINPDKLRATPTAVQFVKDFVASGKAVGAICHGPWLLVEADVLRGKKATSYGSIKTDMKNAGAEWVDLEVVCDQGLVTSRKPDDLPAFIRKMTEEILEGRHDRSTAGVSGRS